MQLKIQNIECYSYHGCLKEEALIGGNFSVDVLIDYDFSKAITTDDLIDTFDYCILHDIVRSEMNIPSKLIEHVAGRIKAKIQGYYTFAKNVKVTVTKFNPPVNGFIQQVSFEV